MGLQGQESAEVLAMTLWSQYCYHPHFLGQETESQGEKCNRHSKSILSQNDERKIAKEARRKHIPHGQILS